MGFRIQRRHQIHPRSLSCGADGHVGVARVSEVARSAAQPVDYWPSIHGGRGACPHRRTNNVMHTIGATGPDRWTENPTRGDFDVPRNSCQGGA